MQKPFAPIQKMKASEQVAERLLKHILQGGVSPGDRLPAERTLAAQLGVTRTTLREALKKLEQLKLIAIRQGQGIVIEDFQNASIDLLFHLLVVEGEIDVNILASILEARELFGTDVARQAARRAGRQDIQQMRRLMKSLVRASDPAELQLMDFELFRLLALASKNIVYILLMNTIRSIHARYIELFLPLSSTCRTALQQEIFQAVAAGDAEKAAEKARAFLHADITVFRGER